MLDSNRFAAGPFLLVAMFAALPAHAVDVTTCGQQVPAGETGVLTADLDCSATNAPAIVLGSGATLDLEGRTLTGPAAPGSVSGPVSLPIAAVFCDCGPFRCHETKDGGDVCRSGSTPCNVTSSTGTGVIRGTTGIVSERSLVAANLLVQPDVDGIYLGPDGRLEAGNVTLEHGTGTGITGGPTGHGVKMMTLSNVSVVGFDELGILASKVRGLQISVIDNGLVGIQAGNVKVFELTATGNGSLSGPGRGAGLYGGKLRLFNSEVTGNSFDGLPVDLFTWVRPKLYDTLCNVSAYEENTGDGPPYESWDVCAND